jgi:hypothetical protein
MMQTQKQHSVTDSFHGLAAAIINRALADLGKSRTVISASDRICDEAMAWINGPDCEAWCLELGIGYEAVKEKAAVLYRCFLEEAEGRVKAPGKPRRSFHTTRGR